MQIKKSFMFQFSYGVNEFHAYIFNYECRITDHPFGSECDKHWHVLNRNSKNWTNDQSITLECKDKGK